MGTTKVAIIGMGNMGSAMEERLNGDEYEITGIGHGGNLSAADDTDMTIVAVKPQSFAEAADDLSEHISERQLIVSIMAGKTICEISGLLGTDHVVRTMPNLALRNGESLTGWYAEEGTIDREDAAAVTSMLERFGVSMRLRDEEQFDSFTALTASAIGYVLEFVVAIEAAAWQQGYTQKEAQKMAVQVLRGAASLVGQGKTAAELVEQITSKGGTTAAAREVFRRHGLARIVRLAVQAATDRSRELGGQKRRRWFGKG